MAIHSSAKRKAIQASVEKYVQDQLQGTDGLTASTITAGTADFPVANIWYQGESFSPDKVDYYLRPTLRRGEGRHFSRVTSANPGHLVHYSLFLDVFVRREYARQQNSRHLIHDALDVIRDSIKGTDSITVKNYDGDGNTTLGKAWVRGLEPTQPAEAEWLSGGWLVTLEWVEQDATAA